MESAKNNFEGIESMLPIVQLLQAMGCIFQSLADGGVIAPKSGGQSGSDGDSCLSILC
jgi:hypothetical protein